MADLFNYRRRATSVVHVGTTDIGGANPIRVQSMTTTNTNDTAACVEQARRIIEAGGELVRLTTQGRREAENLRDINRRLRGEGYTTPLVADVHFNASVADVAALYAEKVRINPGNYVDTARKFRKIEYSNDAEYRKELKKIEDRLLPFIQICRENHTAVRIGVNHGSLSDRIMSRYGDTPEGIVESCMEFLRVFRRERFNDVVISIKASNTVVMVRSVRLLVSRMEQEGMDYPLHLGVTEAGEGEDGRIKSAVGIGALLADGIGDTIRVSLSEEPEAEIPVARHLVEYIGKKAGHLPIPAGQFQGFDYLCPERRKTAAAGNIGGGNVPVVVVNGRRGKCLSPSSIINPQSSKDLHPQSSEKDISLSSELSPLSPDYIYVGGNIPGHIDNGVRYIADFAAYAEYMSTHKASSAHSHEETGENLYPIFPHTAMPFIGSVKAGVKFLVLQYGVPAEEYTACLKAHPEVVVVCMSNHQNRLGEQRALVHEMMAHGAENPVVFCQMYRHGADEKNDFQLEAAADMGALMMDGLCDGIWLMNDGDIPAGIITDTSFGILQAARLRTTKTEYISCPGCGRTLYDLRATIARIKEATRGMKGLKIGIMGCIVNGPGEMADADYGYVGAGVGRISLYRKKECVEKNIPEEEAVEHLLGLIRNDRKRQDEKQEANKAL